MKESILFFPVQMPVILWHELSATGVMDMICPTGLDSTKKYPDPAIILHESNVSGQKRTFILTYTYNVDRNTKNSLENPP
jgi:hypothetical protein